MVGHRLQVAVEGMKGMGCEGSWDCEGGEERAVQEKMGHTKPPVVRLVNILVN